MILTPCRLVRQVKKFFSFVGLALILTPRRLVRQVKNFFSFVGLALIWNTCRLVRQVKRLLQPLSRARSLCQFWNSFTVPHEVAGVR